jgi:hypothetical protein
MELHFYSFKLFINSIKVSIDTRVLIGISEFLVTKFNPLLGETYELVTPSFRFFGEMVSHHPPICCFSCEGKNFQIERVMETQ